MTHGQLEHSLAKSHVPLAQGSHPQRVPVLLDVIDDRPPPVWFHLVWIGCVAVAVGFVEPNVPGTRWIWPSRRVYCTVLNDFKGFVFHHPAYHGDVFR